MHVVPLRIATSAAIAVGLAAIPTSPAQAASTTGMRIVSIYFDSPGSDTGSNTSLNAEWVRLHNTTRSRKNLSGWTLRDAAHHVFHFPNVSVAAGANVSVHTGSGTRTASNLYWGQRWYIWNNDGDKATLRNAVGTTVDTCSYGSSARTPTSC